MSTRAGRMSSVSGKLPRMSGVYKKRPGSLGPSLPPSLPRAGRPSLSRPSNVYSKGSAQPRQDPRPINDKMFQKECMNLLTEYLISHGYNAPISQKLPSGKEIKDIIEFLFRQVDPNIVLGKLEDEVPAFFRNLNYPFQISKSALYAAGSPHSWPGLLAALSWLVSLLIYEERAKEIKEGGGGLEYDGNPDRTLFFEYVSAAYDEFLCGNDEACSKLDEEFRLRFEEEKAQLARQAEEQEKVVVDRETKLQTLTNEPSPLSVLEGRKADYVNDVAKFKTIISNFQSHKEASLKKIEERKQDLEALKGEILKIVEENEGLRQQIGAQLISVAGVEKMDKESQILDNNLHAVTKETQELEKEAWDSEVQSAKMLRELEAAAVSYNTCSARLKHMYAEVDAGQSIHYEIRVNTREDKPEDILGKDIKNVIKPAVVALMQSSERATKDAREEILVIQKKLYADEVSYQEKLDKVSAQVAQNKKLETQYRARKEKLDNYISSKAAERAQMEASLAENEKTIRAMNKDADELLKTLYAEYEEKLKTYKEEMEREQAEILEELQAYVEHKEYIQSALSKLEAAAEKTLEMARNTLAGKLNG